MQDDVRPPEAPHDIVFDETPPPPAAVPKPEPSTPAKKVSNGAVDEQKIEAEFGPAPDMPSQTSEDPKQKSKMKFLPAPNPKHHSRKAELIFAGIAVVIVLAAGVASYLILHNYKIVITPTYVQIHKKPAPTTVASTLTGLQVDPSVNNRQVTAVMIENSIDARPQSGLDQAGIVFEAIAEGGITRFMALYQDTQPSYLGPVRSARPYYAEWALGYDAAYAHVGGSPEALRDIISWHIKDMNQFYNAGAYERISSRYAPHNVYTSAAQLNALEKSKGFTKSTFTGFVRKKEAPSASPTATTVNMTFSGYYYNTQYTYNAKTNNYTRSEAGQPHKELTKDGKLVNITPKVLVALVIPYSLEPDGYHSDYQVIGSGKAFVFQDGTIQTGTWTKASRTAPLILTDAKGQAIALNPGQTWISALASASDVTYKAPAVKKAA